MKRKSLSKEKRNKILAKSNGYCSRCGVRMTVGSGDGTRFTVDHIIPISRGGDYDIRNLTGLCQKCNLDKGNDISFDIIKRYPYMTDTAKEETIYYILKSKPKIELRFSKNLVNLLLKQLGELK